MGRCLKPVACCRGRAFGCDLPISRMSRNFYIAAYLDDGGDFLAKARQAYCPWSGAQKTKSAPARRDFTALSKAKSEKRNWLFGK